MTLRTWLPVCALLHKGFFCNIIRDTEHILSLFKTRNYTVRLGMQLVVVVWNSGNWKEMKKFEVGTKSLNQ